MRVLSVDFGTSNTVAVLSAHGRPPRVIEVDGSATMSSAVFAAQDGGIVVGRDAERQARLSPSRYEPNPKRRIDEGTLLLGETVVTVTDAIAAVLHRVGDETRRQLGGAYPDEVRLTHPAQWGPVRRNVLLSAARLAGFGSNLVLIPEPVAAAAHFASFPERSLRAGQALAVYDLGAGTFDCAVVGATQNGFTVLAEDGLPDLGGTDVDYALLEHVKSQVAHHDPEFWQRLLRPSSVAERRTQRTLREDVRAAKEALSRHMQTEVPMPEPFDDVLVTRAELEGLVRPLMSRSVDLLGSTVRSTGSEPANLAGLYLVGGSSRLPLVATLIGEQLRVVATSLDQPETAVALGAHHVPRDGAAMRTEDLGNQLGEAHSDVAHSDVAQTGPREQPTSETAPVSLAGSGSVAASPTASPLPSSAPRHFPAGRTGTAMRRTASSRHPKLFIAGAAALVAVLVLSAVTVVSLSIDSHPSADACQKQNKKDPQGFTSCLRQLAGNLPESSNCVPGWQRTIHGLHELRGAVVSCTQGSPKEGPLVVYTQLGSMEQARARADLLLTFNGANSDMLEADWSGNGLSGTYRAITSDTYGTVVFTVQDRPLVGMLLLPNAHKRLRLAALADEFERTIQPG